jgi:hypothetical protein
VDWTQGIVYGRLDLTYLGNGTVSSTPNKFNFDRPGIGTAIGSLIAGPGIEYTIFFNGVGYIGD